MLTVEDHGNGFMVIGTITVADAYAIVGDDVGELRFACPTLYRGRGSVWLTNGPGEVWTA